MDDCTIDAILTRMAKDNEVKEKVLITLEDLTHWLSSEFTKEDRLFALMEIESWAKTEQINEMINNKKDKTWY